MTSELTKHLRSRLKAGKKLLVPYLTAGLPSPQQFVQLISDLSSISDAIEIGIPFSDPIMDGPIIQQASSDALAKGITTKEALRLVKEAAKYSSVPLIVMTYFNPVYRAGLGEFIKTAQASGVRGLIIPDVPIEESDEIGDALSKTKIALIQLVAPMTEEKRVKRICEKADGFIYAVSRMGVTGERDSLSASAKEVVERIRPHTELPVLLGIGITNGDQAALAGGLADGVIVGSAIMKQVLAGNSREALRVAKEIRAGLDRKA